MDDGFTQIQEDLARIRRTLRDMQGDGGLAENRVLTAITDVRQLVARVDSAETGFRKVLGEP